MHLLNIKPISVNQCFQGRRFCTDAYKKYKNQITLLLPKIRFPKSQYLEVHLEFGFSDGHSDFDNPVKPFIDALQKKYKFNDNRIKRAVIDIAKAEKGDEYIKFDIKKYRGKYDYWNC